MLRYPRIALSVLVLLGCSSDPTPASPPPFDGGGPPGYRIDSALPDAAIVMRRDGSLPPADYEIDLPYRAGGEYVDVMVTAQSERLDLHLSIDTTSSFGGEIDTLQRDLLETLLPSLGLRIADIWVGVSRFADFPLPPFGALPDQAYVLETPLTSNLDSVAASVRRLDRPLSEGGDTLEAGYEALWQIATGEGYRESGTQWIAPYEGDSGTGGVGWREDTLRVVIHATDAPSHFPNDYASFLPGTHGPNDVIEAFRTRGLYLLGISSDDSARPQLEQMATGTGAVILPRDSACPTGISGAPREPAEGKCPLVFDIGSDGAGLSSSIVDAVFGLVDSLEFAEVYGTHGEDRLHFIRSIEAIPLDPPPGEAGPERTDSHPAGDEILDTFQAVGTGTTLVFRVHLYNEFIEQRVEERLYYLGVRIIGDSHTLLERTIRVRVPPSSVGGMGSNS